MTARAAPGWFASARRAAGAATATLCGLLLLALTGVTVADVVGRYALAAPLPGAAEMTELLVMATVFAGLPAVALADGHVTVDLLTARLRGPAATAQVVAARLLGAAVLALAAWRLWLQGDRLADWGQVTVYLRLPLAPFAHGAAALCAVSALIALALALSRAPLGDGR